MIDHPSDHSLVRDATRPTTRATSASKQARRHWYSV